MDYVQQSPGGKSFSCTVSPEKRFKYRRDALRHARRHTDSVLTCDVCGKTFHRRDILTKHRKTWACRRLDEHRQPQAPGQAPVGPEAPTTPLAAPSSTTPLPAAPEPAPPAPPAAPASSGPKKAKKRKLNAMSGRLPKWRREWFPYDGTEPVFPNDSDEGLTLLYKKYWRHIRSHTELLKKLSSYNFRVDGAVDLKAQLQHIFEEQRGRPFVCDAQLGFVLLDPHARQYT